MQIGSGPDADPANRWDTKRKQFSLAETCARLSAVLVYYLLCLQKHLFVAAVNGRQKDINKIEREGYGDLCDAGLPLWPGDGGTDRETTMEVADV